MLFHHELTWCHDFLSHAISLIVTPRENCAVFVQYTVHTVSRRALLASAYLPPRNKVEPTHDTLLNISYIQYMINIMFVVLYSIRKVYPITIMVSKLSLTHRIAPTVLCSTKHKRRYNTCRKFFGPFLALYFPHFRNDYVYSRIECPSCLRVALRSTTQERRTSKP